MNPIPVTWMALAMVLIAAFSAGSGYHYGGKNCRADQALAAVKEAAVEHAEDAKVNAGDAKNDKQAAVRQTKRQAVQQVVIEKVIEHAQTLPDPVECALAPDRVRNINAAFGFAADSGSEAAGVPETEPAQERGPSAGGGMGDDDGQAIPSVLGPTQRLDRGGSPAAEGN